MYKHKAGVFVVKKTTSSIADYFKNLLFWSRALSRAKSIGILDLIIYSIFKISKKQFINADPEAGFKFEIVLNREIQAKSAAILLPMGLNAKLFSQRTIFLIGLKCIYDSIQICSVCRCNFGTKNKRLLSLASCY